MKGFIRDTWLLLLPVSVAGFLLLWISVAFLSYNAEVSLPAVVPHDMDDSRVESIMQSSRNDERNSPIDSAIRFTKHMKTYAPPTPTPTTEPAPTTVITSDGPSAQQWADLRQCESGGNYQINTGNGYYGAYQFDLTTWQGVGGSGYPHQASPAEQDMRARLLYQQRGAQPWPVCGQYLY